MKAHGASVETGRREFSEAGKRAVERNSAFDEEVLKSCVCVGPGRRFAWRGLFLDVSEDLANEVGVGDVFDDAESATAERAKGDVDVGDPFQSLCPGEGRG